MRRVDLRTVVMPTRVRNEVFRLLATIEVAETAQGLNMALSRAEGFVLGLETSGGFNNDLAEQLYIGFETAGDKRLIAIREQ